MVSGRKPDLERRRRVLQAHTQGYTPREISRRLGISRQAVVASLKSAERAARRSVRCCACGVEIVSAGVLPRDAGRTFCVPCLDSNPQATFGQRLRAFRLAAGLTRTELAHAVGIHPRSVQDYEEDVQLPRPGRQAALAEVLGQSLAKPGT
jgi:DNA-binding XRE family transcriptional regulator